MNAEDIIKSLKDIIQNIVSLENFEVNLNVHLRKTFNNCFDYCLKTPSDGDHKLFEIDSILDYLHEELNTGHWSKVPLHYRHMFTVASFLKAIIILRTRKECELEALKDCLKAVDLGLLLGAPLEDNSEVLTKSARIISETIQKIEYETVQEYTKGSKRKLDDDQLKIFNNLPGKAVNEDSLPSLERFQNKYFSTQIPVKLKDCMNHWPATTKWLDVNYLIKVAGNRTVPIEIGSSYVDENWSQKLLPLKDFIENYYLKDSENLGYLAQHNLFNQIEELRSDIIIPDYCFVSDEDEPQEPAINAWFGPKGTVSPLHFDPKNNILAQVFGTKLIVLHSPLHTPYLYPHEGNMLSNTAQVDPINPDYDKFPDYNKAVTYKCLLEPGEMLFLPKKWWHYVTALDKSFSVSFWWE